MNLSNGAISARGPLVMTATRGPEVGRRFDWSLTIALDDGVLIERDGASAGLVAPIDGYLQEWSCGQNAKDAHWQLGGTYHVYYMRNGRYGRIQLEIYANAEPKSVSIHYKHYGNPTGGRNTE